MRGMNTQDAPDTLYSAHWTDTKTIRQQILPDGTCIRYFRDGSGPPLVLMHTARTQLDYFQRLIPLLRDHFTIYAVDLPGHGWSTIRPGKRYVEPYLRAAMRGFIETLALDDVTLAGESIGGVLSLTLAGEMPEKVRRVVAINPFDYQGGVRRANAIAWAVIGAYHVPGLGTIVSNLENLPILRAILAGGFADQSRLPVELVREFRRVGRRPGYPAMARSLFSAMPSFVAARAHYPVDGPRVTLVYGDKDWSRPEERADNHRIIPDSRMITLEATGHFASLERPGSVANAILSQANDAKKWALP